jgi:hypothetical protein
MDHRCREDFEVEGKDNRFLVLIDREEKEIDLSTNFGTLGNFRYLSDK